MKMKMKKKAKTIFLLFFVPGLLLFNPCGLYPGPEGEKADMILENGTVLTIDGEMRITQAVALKGGRILFTGSDREAARYRGKKTKCLDMKGKTVIPGLHDAHVHFESGAKDLTSRLSLRFLDLAQIQAKIAAVVRASPKGAVIRAYSYNHAFFKDKKWPTRCDLDQAAPKNPVVITRVDGHSVWVNSLALSMSGITADTEAPPGGEILRFKNGLPTGILKETATGLIKNIKGPKMVIPGRSKENLLEAGIAHANRLGLTSVTTSGDLELIRRLNELKKRGLLTLRFNVWLPASRTREYLEKGVTLNRGDRLVKVSFLKIFADGTIGSASAALFKPYRHRPESTGLLMHPPDELDRLVEFAHQNRWQVGVHAIGNRGVRLVLDAVEKAQKKHGDKGLRHRIEHSQFVTDADLIRYKELGVIPSMQPTHCTSDLLVVEDRIGKERARQGYRWNSFQKLGVLMAFGTDWPVEPLDPRRGLYSAVERKNIENGQPVGGWFPGEQVSVTDAVRYYTLGSAHAAFNEAHLGSIEKGKLADLTVFDGDLLQVARTDRRKILTLPLYMTILEGKIVYSKAR